MAATGAKLPTVPSHLEKQTTPSTAPAKELLSPSATLSLLRLQIYNHLHTRNSALVSSVKLETFAKENVPATKEQMMAICERYKEEDPYDLRVFGIFMRLTLRLSEQNAASLRLSSAAPLVEALPRTFSGTTAEIEKISDLLKQLANLTPNAQNTRSIMQTAGMPTSSHVSAAPQQPTAAVVAPTPHLAAPASAPLPIHTTRPYSR